MEDKKQPELSKEQIESFARRIYPTILKFYEDEDNIKKFEEWKRNRE